MTFERVLVGWRAPGGEQHRNITACSVQESVHAIRGADIDVHHRHLRSPGDKIMADCHVLRRVFVRTRNRLGNRRPQRLRLCQCFDQRCEIGARIRKQVINAPVREDSKVGIRDRTVLQRLLRHLGFFPCYIATASLNGCFYPVIVADREAIANRLDDDSARLITENPA